MDRIIKQEELSFSTIEVVIEQIGEDYHVMLQGGDRPHIGCVVLAIPRESLTGDGSSSCTSSVMNCVGHKDEVICRTLAEGVCKKRQAVTVCCGGFHIDNITPEQIREVTSAIDKILASI